MSPLGFDDGLADFQPDPHVSDRCSTMGRTIATLPIVSGHWRLHF
jgi:hypothetical protein